ATVANDVVVDDEMMACVGKIATVVQLVGRADRGSVLASTGTRLRLKVDELAMAQDAVGSTEQRAQGRPIGKPKALDDVVGAIGLKAGVVVSSNAFWSS